MLMPHVCLYGYSSGVLIAHVRTLSFHFVFGCWSVNNDVKRMPSRAIVAEPTWFSGWLPITTLS